MFGPGELAALFDLLLAGAWVGALLALRGKLPWLPGSASIQPLAGFRLVLAVAVPLYLAALGLHRLQAGFGIVGLLYYRVEFLALVAACLALPHAVAGLTWRALPAALGRWELHLFSAYALLFLAGEPLAALAADSEWIGPALALFAGPEASLSGRGLLVLMPGAVTMAVGAWTLAVLGWSCFRWLSWSNGDVAHTRGTRVALGAASALAALALGLPVAALAFNPTLPVLPFEPAVLVLVAAGWGLVLRETAAQQSAGPETNDKSRNRRSKKPASR